MVMSSVTQRATLAGLLLGVFTFCGSVHASSAVSLARAGGFECSESECRQAWSADWSHGISIDNSVAASGGKSLRITSDDRSRNLEAIQTIRLNPSVTGRLLDVRLKMKLLNVIQGVRGWETARCYMICVDTEGKRVSGEEINTALPQVGTHDWKPVRRLMAVPPGCSSIQIVLDLCMCQGSVWFDDVSVVDVSSSLKQDEGDRVRVVVSQTKVVGRLACGLGWNWMTVVPQNLSEQAMATWPDLFERMSYNGDDWIRIGMWPTFCAPKNYIPGGDVGQKYDYDFNNPYLQRICKILDHCQKHRVDVLMSCWRVSLDDGSYFRDVPNSMWLLKSCYDPSRQGQADWWEPYSDQRFAEALAATTRYLVADRGYSCLKYVSLWNEPDLDCQWSKERFYGLYKLVSAELEKRGIRDRVRILGPEVVGTGQTAEQVAEDLLKHKGLVETLAVHDYGGGMEAPTEVTSQYPSICQCAGYRNAIDKLKSNGLGSVPVVITEVGAYGTQERTGDRFNALGALGLGEYTLRCLNSGVGGMLRWQFNASRAAPCNQHAAFEFRDGGIVPNPGPYWGWAALSRWTVKGSNVMETDVFGAKDANGLGRVVATALRAPGGSTTILMVNTGREPKLAVVDGVRLTKGKWGHFYWAAGSPDGLKAGSVHGRRSALTLTLPAESINVLTDCITELAGPAPR